MLKRLYVHNYKCLVNFEINFDKDISLFLGANGSGKSTVFEVLTKLRRVIIGEEKVGNVFNGADSPRWLNEEAEDKNIYFELDVEVESSIFRYLLVISFGSFEGMFFDHKIKEERLYFNKKILIETKDKETILAGDTAPIRLDSSRSSINRYGALITDEFLQYLRTLFIVRINPYEMLSTINKVNAEVKSDFSNYAEWFAHLNEKNRKGVSAFEKAMRDILPGFDYFKIEQAGQAKVLQVDFENKTNKKEIISYYFNELSEGQKVLIALYALVYCAPENSLICIDEPENFLALPEIQPWFDTLYDQCAERGLQTLLISHHPKIINLLASDSGYWFSRENNLTRIQKISPEDGSGLSIAELIDRGWIYEQ
ncbi:AAA family ATPase [Methylobacter sp.]|uniref:AAA family ATPase n=1 Tax=Methylobacter sp. TaxID=2051955 RepID=UPI0024887EA3|nr:AAA family ATPase [Methylobacter sp.]MDI1276107.1 AAA family ATPase [Methylobacter sp.]MDI1356823.1 AAA family ATPase [Methylobacter sp.]